MDFSRQAGSLAICCLATACFVTTFAGCSKRPTVYHDSDLRRSDVLKGPTAFVLLGEIDVSGALPEIVIGYDGDVAHGVSEVSRYLHEYFTGSRMPVTKVSSDRLRFARLADIVDPDRVRDWFSVEPDTYGVPHLHVAEADSLAEVLNRAQIAYALILSDLMLGGQRSIAEPLGLSTSYGIGISAVGFVWSAAKRDLVWAGFLNSDITKRSRIGDREVELLTGWLALDVHDALR
jgi:hypothetical protein